MGFLMRQYKRLFLGASIGLILGLMGCYGFVGYKAVVDVPNQWGDVASIRSLEAGWPSLVLEMANDPNLNSQEQSFYETLSSALWWNKAVRANYAVTKAGLKDLVGTSEIKGEPILGLAVTWAGKNAALIKQELLQAVGFIRFASVYLSVRNSAINYEAESFSATAAIEKKLHEARLELIFANRRLSNLEELQKRFPENTLVANQVVDLKESGAKYLPISTQIITAKSDIFATQERIKQLQPCFEQTQLLAQFVGQAKRLLLKERNGFKLTEQLLAIEAQMRTSIASENLSLLVVLDRIRMDRINIQVQYGTTIQVDLKKSPNGNVFTV